MATFSDIVETENEAPGTVGFVTQSGAYGEKTFMQAAREGVGFSSFISVGNEADLQFTDFISYLDSSFFDYLCKDSLLRHHTVASPWCCGATGTDWGS
jgi:hypothetical protein